MYQNNQNASNSGAKGSQQSGMVPEARQAMANMKQEVANELGITLNKDYNGNLSSKDAGHIGGNMVRKMIEAQERAMGGSR